MPKIFIDVTGDETHWNGHIDHVAVMEPDGLSGTDMALRFGDHEIVLTVNQAITLFDVLDAWVNAGPIREVGAIRKRVHSAVRDLLQDRQKEFRRLFTGTYSEEAFVREVEEYLRIHGIRYRLAEEANGDETRVRRARRSTVSEV